jgi:Tfp pilus assembly pilus retraction ATPase PilT
MAQMNNAIQGGRADGMIPMYIHAAELEKRGIIHREDYE